MDLEFGYFSLNELQEVNGPMGLPDEWDLYFEPKTLRELKEKHEAEKKGRRLNNPISDTPFSP